MVKGRHRKVGKGQSKAASSTSPKTSRERRGRAAVEPVGDSGQSRVACARTRFSERRTGNDDDSVVDGDVDDQVLSRSVADKTTIHIVYLDGTDAQEASTST